MNRPKCLAEVNGTPILKYWLDVLHELGCELVVVNTHYLAQHVSDYVSKHLHLYKGMSIHISHEPDLLGTARTLLKNKYLFDSSDVLCIHADNFTTMDLKSLVASFYDMPSSCLFTMVTFHTSDPKSCGIVEVNSNSIVTSFYEKVLNPPGNLANGAIYMFHSEFIHTVSVDIPFAVDFSSDVIPNYISKIFAVYTKDILIDIGTPQTLALANQAASALAIN